MLVNNAGIAGPTARCEDIELADWERTFAVNLAGQFLCAKLAIPHLRKSRNASIINLSSAAGRFGFPLRTPYAASKWGVIGFTKSLSIELGGDGIRVNAICPGSVAGARIDSVFANKAAARGVPMETVRDEALAKTSLGKLIAPEDIARTIVFLASPAGAKFRARPSASMPTFNRWCDARWRTPVDVGRRVRALGALDVRAVVGIDADLLTVIHERRYLHGDAGLEASRLE